MQAISSRACWTLLLIVLTAAPARTQSARPVPPATPPPAEAAPALEAPAPTATGALDSWERDEVVGLLQGTLEETSLRVKGLSEGAWNWKPADDRWSIAEVVEHIFLVESVFATLEQALAGPVDSNWREETAGKEIRIYSFMPDRSRKANAPAFAVPQGGKDRVEMLEALAASRKAWVARIQEPGVSFKAHTAPHPAFGTLNMHQWFLFIGLHHLRHNLQIVEVMAEPGFPH